MGRQCLYCNRIISEYAIECPNPDCRAVEPLNESRKRIIEEQISISKRRELSIKKAQEIKEMTELEMKQLFPYTLTCLDHDCHRKLKVPCFGHYTCPHCGYPDNYIRCICGKSAVGYDPISRQFLCKYHLPEPCSNCYEFVVGSDKIIDKMQVGYSSGSCSGGGPIYDNVLFCPACHDRQFPKKIATGCLSGILIISLFVIISYLVLIIVIL